MSESSTDESWKLAWSTFESLMDLNLSVALRKLADQEHLSQEVKHRVKQLLTNLPAHNNTFDALADAFIAQGTTGLTNLSGQTIGSYQLLELIGQGGMSSVYAAKRTDSDIQKKVAIKIMHPYSVSATSMRLFNREQMALAQLNHPNIISFHHGGYTTDGTPFLVTDFVADAVSINAYVKENGLSRRAVIKLFIKVLDAINYAHMNLIIHRDLKPSNLLVDIDGRLKVVDFGIATLDSRQKEHTTLAFTPEYAAPEQLFGQVVTTQTDVFSLGVVLMAMLTGEKPLPEFKQRMAGEDNDEKHIFRVLNNSVLNADLQNIIFQATQSDPTKRYFSVVDLRQDLMNWLQHKPIMATKQTLVYRFKKFISRNKAVSILLLLVFISLLMGLITTFQQKKKAQYEALKANEVKLFLMDALSSSDPDVAAGKDLSVRDLLLEAQVNLSQRPMFDVELQAELLQTIGVSLGKIGEFELAIEQLEQVKTLTQTDVATTEALIVDLLFAAKQFDLALPRFNVLWQESNEAIKKSYQMTVLKVKEQTYMGEFTEAEKLIIHQLSLSGKHDMSQSERIELNQLLATTYLNNNKSDESENLLIKTLKLGKDYYGEINTKTIDIMLDLAEFYEHQSDHGVEKSLGYLQQARVLQNQLYQVAHPKIVTTSIRLANVYKVLGKDDAAFETVQKAKSMAIQLYGENNILAARADVTLSHLALKSGNLDAATALLQDAVLVYEENYGADHFETNQYKTNLASYLLKAGRAERALVLLNELYDHQAQQLGPNHMATVYVQLNQIKALTALGRYDEAIILGNAVLPVSLEVLGEDQVITVGVGLALGVAYYESRDYRMAVKYLAEGEQSAIVNSNQDYHMRLLKQLITSYIEMKDFEVAQKYYDIAQQKYLKKLSQVSPEDEAVYILLKEKINAAGK